MSHSKYLLSICITSYKRTKELKRCLESIDSKEYADKIEIIVSEDNSPQRNEIKAIVEQYATYSHYHVIFNTNENNLGYDRNLKKLQTLATGEYVFYLSDDDCLFPEALDKIIRVIEEREARDTLLFSPFWYERTKEVRRKHKSKAMNVFATSTAKSEDPKKQPITHTTHILHTASATYMESVEPTIQTIPTIPIISIPKGQDSAGKYLYDAILFSGLVFKRSMIIDLDAEPFKNLNYFQVYMFLYCMYHYGACYIDVLTINSVSDGENAYGQVESSEEDVRQRFLADRNSIYSNLAFNKGLSKVVRIFDADFKTQIFSSFSREYSLRTFGGLCRARRLGLKEYKNYWKQMKELDIDYSVITYIYYFVLYTFGAKMGGQIFRLPKAILRFIRTGSGTGSK